MEGEKVRPEPFLPFLISQTKAPIAQNLPDPLCSGERYPSAVPNPGLFTGAVFAFVSYRLSPYGGM